MNIDQNVMVHFVQLVEKYPVLYDSSAPGYLNRDLVDSIWQQIAQMINEPVTQCKERWKNIRSSYVRWLREAPKTGTGRRKKPYYLARYLHYLDAKRKKSSDSLDPIQPEISIKEENSDDYVNDDDRDEDGGTPVPTDTTWPLNVMKVLPTDSPDGSIKWAEHIDATFGRKRLMDSSSDEDYDVTAKKKPKTKDSCDLLFFKSILPKIETFNDSQKLQLQVTILQKILEFSAENNKT